MIAMFRNDWARTWQNKARLFVMLGLIVVSILLAVFVSSKGNFSTKIGVIGASKQELVSDAVKIDHLSQAPAKSALALGTYDAIVDMRSGAPVISTFKGEKYKTELIEYFNNPQVAQIGEKNSEGIGSKIIGYMLMFLLMSSVTNMLLFSEDKEKHIMERITTTPVSFTKLFTVYAFFSWLLLVIPNILIIAGVSFFGVTDIGLSLLNYTALISVIALFATAYSICNASFFKVADTASMLGSMIMMITTILSGSFFSLDNGNKFFNGLIHWLPQKQFLELVKNIEAGQSYSGNYQRLFYLIGISILLLAVAIFKTRKEYVHS
ncbi:ABC transporter permease [Candidatus Enterococcus murrayae]|uniref:ABC transporter permease n=1 Tax=Candidatus Enterococcus murrayae TaxID=2815321 RepID=A0ABS3HGB0_9ENTE|nr:ABC transporter permease [Enterococcus sp. MJM16]MBO0452491.1 ABC transporter permease [Enterococcus sp. MJM16]